MRFRFLPILAALLWALVLPGAAGGADGDAFTGATFGGNLGQINITASRLLCDSKDENDSACSEFDIVDEFSGMPDILILEINTSADCTGTTNVDVDTNPTSAGTEHEWVDLSSTTTRAIVDVRTFAPDRYLNPNLSNMTACTDFDVLIHAGAIVEAPR